MKNKRGKSMPRQKRKLTAKAKAFLFPVAKPTSPANVLKPPTRPTMDQPTTTPPLADNSGKSALSRNIMEADWEDLLSPVGDDDDFLRLRVSSQDWIDLAKEDFDKNQEAFAIIGQTDINVNISCPNCSCNLEATLTEDGEISEIVYSF